MPIDVASAIPADFTITRAFLEYCEPFRFPDSYAVFGLLTTVSAAINGRILVNPGAEPSCFTNMYTVLYGTSGCGKNTAIRQCEDLLSASVPEAPMLPEGFTFESLKSYLAKESAEKHMAKGFIVTPELTNLIGGREYQKLTTSFLSDLWDCRPEMPYFTQAHQHELIEKPYVVHLAATSPEWLLDADPRSLGGGYLRRIIMIVEYAGKHQRSLAKKDKVAFGAIAKVMRQRLAPGVFGGTMMTLTPETLDLMDAWYHAVAVPMMQAPSDIQSKFASTMQVHVLKVAACLSVLEGGAVYSKRDGMWLEARFFSAAAKLVEAVLPPMFQAYNALVPTTHARIKATALRIVMAAGEGGVEESELYIALGDALGQKEGEIGDALVRLVREKRLEKKGQRYVLGVRRA